MTTPADLLAKRCRHLEDALSADQIDAFLWAMSDWKLDKGKITRTFEFRDYYENLAFLNAMAYIIHAEDHHPEIVLTYNRCVVRFDTHSVNGGKGGISENDFICAAKVDALYQQSLQG